MAYTTIDDPSAHFTITLYTGTGSSRNVTNDANAGDLAPDLLWIKERSATSSSVIFDTNRPVSSGYAPNLHSDADSAEDGDTSELTAFGSNGFTYGSDGKGNEDTQTYVAWQWKANGGTLTSVSATGAGLAQTYQANTTAGFSIITYTGDGNNNATVQHGLGATPDFIMLKSRGYGTGGAWLGWNQNLSAIDYRLDMNNDGAQYDDNTGGLQGVSSTLITLGSGNALNRDGDTYVCYAWTEIQGYSKFGSYQGNGSTNGSFVYTGFKPARVMHKRIDSTGNWFIFDNKRLGYNSENHRLIGDTTLVEADAGVYDLLSNGFKLGFTSGNANADNGTYIYMAFAEQPFVSSEGIPATAR